MEIAILICMYAVVGFVVIYILPYGHVRTNWGVWYTPRHKRDTIIFTTLAAILWPLAPTIMRWMNRFIVKKIVTKASAIVTK